jgi:hypothetical protein
MWGTFSDERTGLSQLLLALTSARDSPNLEGQVPVFTSPKNRVAKLYSQALISLFSSFTISRAIVDVFILASTQMDSEPKSHFTTGSLWSISLSWYQAF